MLSMKLMCEVSRRTLADEQISRPLLDDACLQAAYCLDAPDDVQDGMEWYEDEDFSDCCGPVPRMVAVRERANARLSGPQRPAQEVEHGTK